MELVKIRSITPNPDNPRLIKNEKYKLLLHSVKVSPAFMLMNPIKVDLDNMILGGNMRYKACMELKKKEVPIEVFTREHAEINNKARREEGIEEATYEEQCLEFIIKDNISFGEHDWDVLANEWDSVQLEEWGLDGFPFEEVELDAVEDDYTEPDSMKVDVVLGDLIEIGEHRLLCGDSTDSDQVAKLMNGDIIDLVFTDPPYGISVVQGSKVAGNKGFGSVGGEKIVKAKNYSEIIGDDTTDTAKEFYKTCISLGMQNFIIWGGNYFTDFLAPSMCWIVWDKENTGNFADVELAWTSFDKAAKLYKWQWNGMIRKGDKSIEGTTRVHPTQKPVGMFGEIFNDFDFNICFDGFLGSGSTMVAAHQLKRKCYGMELDPKYCQVIIDRMMKLDDSLKVKINGKKYSKK